MKHNNVVHNIATKRNLRNLTSDVTTSQVSHYQTFIDEISVAIVHANIEDKQILHKLPQWVRKMNSTSWKDFPYDLDKCQQKSTTILTTVKKTNGEGEESETPVSETLESPDGSSTCKYCRHQDISLKHLPDLLNVKFSLARFNVSARSTSKVTKLKNGVSVPRIAFGCGMLGNGPEVEETLYQAIKMGYRHFDTAQGYGKSSCII